MSLNNPKPKFINGSKFVNEQKIVDVYTAGMEGPKVKDNLGAGPKGQRSKVQIKKVPFKGLF